MRRRGLVMGVVALGLLAGACDKTESASDSPPAALGPPAACVRALDQADRLFNLAQQDLTLANQMTAAALALDLASVDALQARRATLVRQFETEQATYPTAAQQCRAASRSPVVCAQALVRAEGIFELISEHATIYGEATASAIELNFVGLDALRAQANAVGLQISTELDLYRDAAAGCRAS